jgi:hypothetical protein
MKLDEAASALIGRIYDCALDTSLWPDVLEEITHLLNGRMGDLSVGNPLEGTARVLAFYNWLPDVLERAQAYVRFNPVAPIGLTAPLCEPLCSTRDLDIEAFHNSRYWQTCFADGDYYDYLVVVIARTATSFGYWGVMGDNARGAFSDQDLELARLLSPHIRRSVEISGMLGNQRVEARTLKSALNALASGALILEPQGTIRFLNPPAQAELARGTLLRDSRNRLIGVTPERLCLKSSVSGLPWRVVPEDSVEGGEELSHDRDKGDLLRSPSGDEPVVEGPKGGMAADGSERRHV